MVWPSGRGVPSWTATIELGDVAITWRDQSCSATTTRSAPFDAELALVTSAGRQRDHLERALVAVDEHAPAIGRELQRHRHPPGLLQQRPGRAAIERPQHHLAERARR